MYLYQHGASCYDVGWTFTRKMKVAFGSFCCRLDIYPEDEGSFRKLLLQV